MRRTIDETNRRRAIQQQYNKDHNIVPSAVKNDRKNSLARNLSDGYYEPERSTGEYLAEDPVLSKMSEKQLLQAIEAAKKRMEEAAKELDFPRAAKFRDEMYELMKLKK
jgi:excinuclease ABC subunit B